MFIELCRLTGFELFSEPVSVGQLWAANPDLFQRRLDLDSNDPSCVSAHCLADPFDPALGVISLSFVHPGAVSDVEEPEAVASYIEDTYGPFPCPITPVKTDSSWRARYAQGDFVNLTGQFPISGLEVLTQHLKGRGRVLGYNEWILPRIGGVTPKPHALVLWWALFFCLSLRARYEPEDWSHDLDPDRSPMAVQLEDLLSASVDRSYTLLLHAINSAHETTPAD